MYLLHKIGKGIKTEIELGAFIKTQQALGSEARDLFKKTQFIYTFFDPVKL